MNDLNNILAGAGINTNNEQASELLDRYGLNWEVDKLKLTRPDGSDSGFYGITRLDKNITFATCKDGYEVFQNSELLDLVNEAAHRTSLNLKKGGYFKDGALVYLQLENKAIEGIGANNDSVKRFVTGINSHDGSTSLRWGLTNITISCSNTFWHAYSQMQNTLKHTQSLRDRIEGIVKQIKKVQEVEQTYFQNFMKLANTGIKPEHIQKTVKAVLNIDLPLDKKPSDIELTSYQKNRLNDLTSAIARETQQKGSSLWGLFSGVTYYTTHLTTGSKEGKLQSKAIGQSYKQDNKAFDMLVEEAETPAGNIYSVN